MLVRLSLLFLLSGLICAHKPHERFSSFLKKSSRAQDLQLGNEVRPVEYNLTLTVHIDKFNDKNADYKFEGEVSITINVSDEQKSIVLHKAKTIEITRAVIIIGENEEPIDLDQTYDSITNKLTLTPKNQTVITVGSSKINIIYTGLHANSTRGFYRSSYVNELNETRWLVTTQFESYDARSAFPSFDEPKLKAKYTITIRVPQITVKDGYGVLSNMPLEENYPDSTADPEYVVYKFKKSVKPISSYLVAFIVSDFAGTEVATFEGESMKQFRTWGRPSSIAGNRGHLSQIAGPAALDVLKEYTNVPFGYPKVDQAAVPDLSFGAMENWGLCIYREARLLINETVTPIETLQSIVRVVTHELSHQWFGDLVTLYWWSDIWLNEGFATFFEYHAANLIKVEGLDTSSWNLIGQMVVDQIQASALALDAQENTRALHTEVNSLAEIDANFDDIAYSKGGSILRMWMHVLTEPIFRLGLEKYLNTRYVWTQAYDVRAEDVGTPEFLLEGFRNAAIEFGNPIADNIYTFMKWVQQPGYPVIKVTQEDNKYQLQQERFLVSGQPGSSKWDVPITYTTSINPKFDSTTPSHWLLESDNNLQIERSDENWILVNIQETGYYRVNYETSNWIALTEILHSDHLLIHELNRAQLLDDALSLAKAVSTNYTTYGIALNITNYLKNERDLVPWKAGLNGLDFLYWQLAKDENVGGKIKNHILQLIGDVFDELSLNITQSDSHTARLLRSQIATWACRLQYESCVSQAIALFNEIEDLIVDTTPPDIRSTVICTAVRQGGTDTWNRVKEAYQVSQDVTEQGIFLSALGCTTDVELLQRFLGLSLNNNGELKKQDRSHIFSSVYNGNADNVAVALTFLQDNLEGIANSYDGLDPLGSLLTNFAVKLGTNQDLETIKSIQREISESPESSLLHNSITGANTAVDLVTSNNAWNVAKFEEVSEWLMLNAVF